jgi:hypothetical protein
MKIAKLIISAFIAIIISAFVLMGMFVVAGTGVALAQTSAPLSTHPARVHIPYDFWIEGTHLPAGDYILSPLEDTIVLFRNAKIKTQEQATSLMPTGQSVAAYDHKLVFVVHNGQHNFREIWNSDGKEIATSQFDLPLPAGDTETEVRLLEQKR